MTMQRHGTVVSWHGDLPSDGPYLPQVGLKLKSVLRGSSRFSKRPIRRPFIGSSMATKWATQEGIPDTFLFFSGLFFIVFGKIVQTDFPIKFCCECCESSFIATHHAIQLPSFRWFLAMVQGDHSEVPREDYGTKEHWKKKTPFSSLCTGNFVYVPLIPDAFPGPWLALIGHVLSPRVGFQPWIFRILGWDLTVTSTLVKSPARGGGGRGRGTLAIDALREKVRRGSVRDVDFKTNCPCENQN